MASHTHSCSGEVVDALPGGAGPRVAMCVMHLIVGVAAAIVGGVALAVVTALSQ
jgi:hypothetical protein